MLSTEKHASLKGLYAITQDGLPSKALFEKTEAILANGATLLQYRDKSNDRSKRLEEALWLKQCCQEYNCLFLINDDIELADEVSADGVHLGKDDDGYTKAREQLGNSAIIGISCYNQIDRAIEAQDIGASYAAFGAMFSSTTKPNTAKADINLLKQAKQQLTIPICAIGGITTNQAPPLIDAQVDMLAVISDLYSAQHPGLVARQYRELFEQSLG